MKRYLKLLGLIALLCLTLPITLVACDPAGGEETTPEITVDEVTPAPTDAPTEPPTEKETESMTEPVTTEAPTEAPTEPETEKVPDGTIPFVPDHPETIDTDWKAIWIS